MNNPVSNIIIDFLTSIGIVVITRPIDGPVFLPGLRMENGTLVVDPEKLLYPGDILHEAGHLATMPPEIRATMSDNLENNDLNQGGEMMAIAWSYAACLFLNLDPHIVFHAGGYKGDGAHIAMNFNEGHYIGLPLLQWAGMAYDKKNAAAFNALPYPAMIRWLREN